MRDCASHPSPHGVLSCQQPCRRRQSKTQVASSQNNGVERLSEPHAHGTPPRGTERPLPAPEVSAGSIYIVSRMPLPGGTCLAICSMLSICKREPRPGVGPGGRGRSRGGRRPGQAGDRGLGWGRCPPSRACQGRCLDAVPAEPVGRGVASELVWQVRAGSAARLGVRSGHEPGPCRPGGPGRLLRTRGPDVPQPAWAGSSWVVPVTRGGRGPGPGASWTSSPSWALTQRVRSRRPEIQAALAGSLRP